jgi:fructokinase
MSTALTPSESSPAAQAPLIVSMGEMLIDFIPTSQPDTAAAIDFRMHSGGSPYNVAIGLGRLGARVAFMSKASTDYFGRYLTRHLEAEGVDTRFLPTDPAFSTLAFVAYENGEPNYSFYGDDMADTKLSFDDVPEDLFSETRLLHMGSISLLRGSSPLVIFKTAERLKIAGKTLISFDPNIRPGLVKDRKAFEAVVARGFALADVVKISAADLAWLMPNKPLGEAARAIQGYGPALVVITRGGEGAIALHGNHALIAPVFKVKVKDTVGAGDAFSAGLLAEFGRLNITQLAALEDMRDPDLAAALRFASATAALTCTRVGANPPTRAEVETLLG